MREQILIEALEKIAGGNYIHSCISISKTALSEYNKAGEEPENESLLNLLVYYQSMGDQYRGERLLVDVIKDFKEHEKIKRIMADESKYGSRAWE